MAMPADDGGGADSGGVLHGQAQGGAELVRSEAREVGVHRIEVRRREVAGVDVGSGGARARLSCVLCARARKGEREGESELGIPLSNVGA